jgi:hypothetical protein
MRRAVAAGVGTLALLAAAPARSQVQAVEPTFQLDAKHDVRGPLDAVRVAMSTRPDGSERGEVTMRAAWDTADVGNAGSICLKLYVKADPDGDPPDYLVCATPDAAGTGLTGRVLRNRANGLPVATAPATLSRPTARTLYLSFEPGAIRSPAKLRFAAETVWRGSRKCPRATGCTDLAPNAPGARDFRLHQAARSG